MRILAMRPEPPGAGNVVASFDLELNGDVRLYGFSLKRSGTAIAPFPPQDRRSHRYAASFAPAVIREIRELAVAHYQTLQDTILDQSPAPR